MIEIANVAIVSFLAGGAIIGTFVGVVVYVSTRGERDR